jgi:hypothetical protein
MVDFVLYVVLIGTQESEIYLLLTSIMCGAINETNLNRTQSNTYANVFWNVIPCNLIEILQEFRPKPVPPFYECLMVGGGVGGRRFLQTSVNIRYMSPAREDGKIQSLKVIHTVVTIIIQNKYSRRCN